LYEFFKKFYSDAVGAENAEKYRTFLFLGASASAEFFADIGLCPFEAVKVRVQTQPGFAKGLSDGLPKLYGQEGFLGYPPPSPENAGSSRASAPCGVARSRTP
jgi:solute carrier family 25 (mitochondrial phosphate transporter), member 3